MKKQRVRSIANIQRKSKKCNLTILDFVVSEADIDRAVRIMDSTNYLSLASSAEDVRQFYAYETAMIGDALEKAGIPFDLEYETVVMNPDDLVNDWNRGRIKKMALAN